MKKITLGLGILALTLGIVSISAASVFAYQGDPTVQGPNYSVDRHEAMEEAFENNDYEAWKNLMVGNGRVMQVVNKDNFSKFAEAHELAEQGNTVEAQKIRQDLGLGLRNGSGSGAGSRDGNGRGNAQHGGCNY
ncbi:hypothetical protein GW920_01160 [Candidatus Falkowbacteria bacterium]|uniref:Uncharacterized protein n=1 Tax=Candidatus Falkowbacteria bacterium CG10_big_fil_rev_8_21_14_0_10_37_18 TaxID=1974562 RepID=A0A2H0V8K4_9BACT|nr:hypothetical protein [Candidatus Falkowbacteria bacterium]NCQ12763.1 hypothetical protein [Candidatus Falkowbacteria bacterium]OIO06141.1 MAG: hypothetical protein AUJ26_01395 [Candidatus Falkowbacteria bacterium CG1_02_37_21]PIR95444.1 MAG: hypothetical protein COT93_02370 [Candidatus Falkowbacteria bacterium CG10_big_fil_rev_8_21_14_0_10_37_18]